MREQVQMSKHVATVHIKFSLVQIYNFNKHLKLNISTHFKKNIMHIYKTFFSILEK